MCRLFHRSLCAHDGVRPFFPIFFPPGTTHPWDSLFFYSFYRRFSLFLFFPLGQRALQSISGLLQRHQPASVLYSALFKLLNALRAEPKSPMAHSGIIGGAIYQVRVSVFLDRPGIVKNIARACTSFARARSQHRGPKGLALSGLGEEAKRQR